MRVLTAAQMREADRRAIEDIGIPSLVLMENAGRAVAAAMDEAFDDLAAARVAILAGRGNNGGDGFVVARVLHARGTDVSVFVVGGREAVRGDARVNLGILDRLGLAPAEIATEADWRRHRPDILGADLVVDALFGTGLTTPLSGLHADVVADLNDADVPVVAVDLPSGMSADACGPIGPHIAATLTVTLGAPKLPLVVPPTEGDAGNVVVADIGIPAAIVQALDGPVLRTLDADDLRPRLPLRPDDAHKGTFGHVLIVAGSRGRTGAAALAGRGALRSGAGLVSVATPASCLPTVAALGAEYMTIALDDDDGACTASALRTVLDAPGDVLAIGPGLGTGDGAVALVRGVLEESRRPLVLDADAITILARLPEAWHAHGDRPVVITPHPGELARLAGVSTADIQRDRVAAARATAARHGVWVVLKGHRTVIATPEGHVSINTTGNPGMATGGSGDVLTGMVAAWLAQVKDPEAAGQIAVYLHGLAGDLAALALSETAMTAGDLLDHLGPATRMLAGGGDDNGAGLS